MGCGLEKTVFKLNLWRVRNQREVVHGDQNIFNGSRKSRRLWQEGIKFVSDHGALGDRELTEVKHISEKFFDNTICTIFFAKNTIV